MSYELKNGENAVTVNGCQEPIYIRTDKNGTKIYHDVNCSRCAGAGKSNKWAFTGKICYECGGTGLRLKPREVKVYTKDYADKLKARRAARAASVEKIPKVSDAMAKKNAMQSCGFDESGKGFLYIGDTYNAKEDIRRIGGKWCNYVNGWVAPVRISLSDVLVSEISASDVCNMYGYIDPELMWEFIDGRKNTVSMSDD